MTVRLLQGDCRATLPTLEPGQVQSVMTSPPYMGLRDYGTPPLVWGQTCCDHPHEWANVELRQFTAPPGTAKQASNKGASAVVGRSAFCQHVHDWGIPSIVRAAGYEAGEKARWNHRENGRGEAQERILAKEPGWTRKDVVQGSTCACGAWLGSLGLEPTAELYIEHLVECFRHVRRVLRDDGTLWVNLGDSYAGSGKGKPGKDGFQSTASQMDHVKYPDLADGLHDGYHGLVDYEARPRWPTYAKPKDLLMMPARVAMALQADGWWLRSMIPWLKRNSMPESIQGSHWSRHQVTIAEYERLSGLRYTGERSGDARASDVPWLPASAVLGGKAAVSEEPEGSGDAASPRAARGREGEASSVLGVRARAGKQRKVRADTQGEGDAAQASGQLSLASAGSGGSADRARLDSDSGAPQVSLPLLRQATDEDDAGSRDPAEQGRAELPGERGPSVPFVQLQEEGQTDPTLLVDCPGCPKCQAHDGYIFHLSAWRPSTSVEYVFLFSKSASYYSDADAVRVASNSERQHWTPGAKCETVSDTTGRDVRNDGLARLGQRMNDGLASGRNRRNSDWFFESWQGLMSDEDGDPLAFVVNPQPFSGSHFATFPPKLVEPMILASTRPGDVVLDPFGGAGTVGLVADRLGRNAVLCELKPEYAEMGSARIVGDAPLFADVDGGGGSVPAEPLEDKQGASGLRRYAGFNARWDAKEETA